jgi:pimeloyl-ACP methyl ester carboxylesterase
MDIDIPVLVMWGEQDAWLPLETGKRLGRIIPNAQFEAIPNAGHFSPEDAPEFVAKHIGEFLHRER